MKLTWIAIFMISSSAFAQNTPCAKKQILAAKQQLASVLRISVNNVKLVKYENGAWSEAMANNYGSDNVSYQ